MQIYFIAIDCSGIADKGKFKVEKKRVWGKRLRLTDTIRMTGSALLVMDYPSAVSQEFESTFRT